MKTTHNNRKSKFLAFLLSVMMISTAGAMFASCADSDDSSSTSSSEETTEEEETRTDDGDIKNANFDFTTIDKKTVIGTSVTGWSKSTADTSNASSGVIDTSSDIWEYLMGDAIDVSNLTEAEAIEKWDTFNVKTKRAYYDKWKADNSGKSLSTSTFEKYESSIYNLKESDFNIPNPGTHDDELDSKVLMLHNHYYNSASSKEQLIGTAQSMKSSSTVTVPAGSAAKVSVWVKTADLKMAASGTPADHEVQDAVGKGAYISITHSVGGKSLDAYEVKNINVDDWTQYTFYIQGSNYADTTYSLTLGLGQGNTSNRLDYVNGYAFFDDIQCDLIDTTEFAGATFDVSVVEGLDADKVDKTVDAYALVKKDSYNFGMNFSTGTWEEVEYETLTSSTLEDFKTEDKFGKNPEANTLDKVTVGKVSSFNDANNSNLKIVYDKFLASEDTNPFVTADDEIFLMLSNDGTAYTVENVVPTFKLAKDNLNTATQNEQQDYMAISFYVKTSDMNGGVGAGVTLVDDLAKTSFTSIDTTDIAKVKIGDDEDAYDGWQRVLFFVERGEDVTSEIELSLTFNYGPTDITSTTSADSFQQGFAAFAKFSYCYLTELEYEAAATGTYAKKVTVYGEKDDEAAGNSGFDSAAGVPDDALENGYFANPQNYKGVYNDSYRVALPKDTDTDEIKEEKRAYNQYKNAGLLNRENYKAFLEQNGVTVTEEKAAELWKATFGDATQPLVIDNSGLNDNSSSDKRSYGFIGNSKSFSDEYTAVSIRVMTTEGSKASVYLMDMSDDTRQTVLSVSRSLTYWYDTDGNICTGDPSEKTSKIAFNLEKNGLYKANKNWENYDRLGSLKDAYFANLNAYTEKDGIYYANENSANHDYYDYTWNREVFYKHEGVWYTEKDGKGVQVNNLADITEGVGNGSSLLKARFLPETKQELKLENIDTQGVWTTVTFYIRKGETAKSYRLEVWSGTRDGKTVNTTGFVAFDTNNPGTASSNFDTLIEEFEDSAEVKFDSVFSYYDTDMHVRYDANLDEDKSGNAYADNIKATLSAESSTAFLKHYSAETGYNLFADYSLSDKTVAASEVTDDDTTDDSSDDEDPDSDVNVWLLASSIAVAGVLVLAVVSIIVRKIVENARKKNGRRVRKTKETKAPKQKKVEKTVDEDSPYND